MLAITTPLGVILLPATSRSIPLLPTMSLFDLPHRGGVRQERRPGAVLRQQPRGAVRLHALRARRARSAGGYLHARRTAAFTVTCFASSIHRIQLLVDLAFENGRQVAFVGRSMENNTAIAHRLGFLTLPMGVLLRPGEIKQVSRRKAVGGNCRLAGRTAIGAGSRVGPESQARGHRSGGTVVLSFPDYSRQREIDLPHVESPLQARRGSDLRRRSRRAHPRLRTCQSGELKLMLNSPKPKYFIPIHGEYRQLAKHASLASHLKSIKETFLMESGDVLEFDSRGARKAGKVNVCRVCIDSGSVRRGSRRHDHPRPQKSFRGRHRAFPSSPSNRPHGKSGVGSGDCQLRFRLSGIG